MKIMFSGIIIIGILLSFSLPSFTVSDIENSIGGLTDRYFEWLELAIIQFGTTE